MKKSFFFFIVFLFVFSCQKQQAKKEIKNVMIKQSEMAALMLRMYSFNEENKKMILKGVVPKKYSSEFINIHTAKLTDPSDRDTIFKSYADFYLENQKALFNTSNLDSLVSKHNNVVNSCIACHKATCIGPIPRINKLLIK